MIDGFVAHVLGLAHEFPGLKQVAYVRRIYWKGENKVTEGRYFLTSLPRNRLSAKRFLQKITSHWEIENSLHNVKDKHWQEDKHYTARVSLGCIQAMLRNLSLNALRLVRTAHGSDKLSLAAKSLQMLAQPLNALGWLNQI